MRLALYDNAMRVIKNWEMTRNIDVTYVKSPNPINFLVNILKNVTNLLISNKEDQLKDKKKHWKKKPWQLQEKNTDTQNSFFIIIQPNGRNKNVWFSD